MLNSYHAGKFMTGARPSPPQKLLAAMPFLMPIKAAPPQAAYVPDKLDMWGNNQYGDCVSAEEAFAKACYMPEIFIPSETVISWARAGGFLNGADLTSVMDAMKAKGFAIGGQTYNDGNYAGVDFSNESVLQAALSNGPVKIGIDSGALPEGAGNQQGWYTTASGNHRNEDHCVALCGYGPPAYLYEQLKVALPNGLPSGGYLLFTWSTIGFVTHDWIMGTVGEAWLRTPTTVGVPPLEPSLLDWTQA